MQAKTYKLVGSCRKNFYLKKGIFELLVKPFKLKDEIFRFGSRKLPIFLGAFENLLFQNVIRVTQSAVVT